ncbi:hypothetical protein KIN20_027214 [Parelaphostrongylus tenuis]|uniref:Uncharacterized protein n=1 Tax=Parelaphostrongylus tenuis TaxID=148309 RepID=A0AAD5QZ32_PARTN|nr:hypothetical protein KIN20_027214 [Parelaphostrongylus tenuis]
MIDGRKEQCGGLEEKANILMDDYPEDGRACLWPMSTVCLCRWQRVWNLGMSFTYVAMFETDHFHGRQLRERETKGNYVGIAYLVRRGFTTTTGVV